MRGALNARVVALAFIVLGLCAGQAQGAVRTVPSKVALTEVLGNFELRGVVTSRTARCQKDRLLRYKLLSGRVSNRSASTGEWSLQGDWYEDPSVDTVTVKVVRSEPFGKPGRRKVCGADTALLSAQRADTTISNFAFDDWLDNFSGDISSGEAASCVEQFRTVQVSHANPFQYQRLGSAVEGSFVVGGTGEPPAGDYTAYVFTEAVDFLPAANGNASVVACDDDFSDTLAVT